MGKLHPADRWHLQQGSNYLAQLLQESITQLPVRGEVLLIGLTESGIVPSFLMYLEACRQAISCEWICSTRCTHVAGIPFEEVHSHGPHHLLPLPQNQAAEVWIVEDEITSGTTVQNLISQIQDYLAAPIIRIFSFADSRSAAQKEHFVEQFSKLGRTYLFHSLASAIDLCSARPELCNQAAADFEAYSKPLLHKIADQLNKKHLLGEQYGEHLFVIGEAVSTAVLLVAAGVFNSFQHITLSPWAVDCININSRIQFTNYYLYNYQGIARPVHLFHNPADQEVGEKVKTYFEEMNITVELFS